VRASTRINTAGLTFVASFEGLRLYAYPDIGGVWTIGYGHTRTAQKGMSITKQQAMSLLKADLAVAEQAVHLYVHVGLNQNRYNALVSFVFNVGVGAFRSSTLLKQLNGGDYGGVPKQLLRWNKVNGRPIAGLTRRRVAEGELWRLKA
jgi:lysozyme